LEHENEEEKVHGCSKNGGVDSSLEALDAKKVKWRENLEDRFILGKEAREVLGRN